MGEIYLLIINGLLLVTTIVIARIYYGQLQQMTRATEATQKAAKAAQESADLARQQIVNSQAAILSIDFSVLFRFLPGEAHGLRSIVRYNSGTAAATKIHVSIDASWVNVPGLTNIGDPVHVEYDIHSIREKGAADVHMIPLRGLDMESWEPIRQQTTDKTIAVKGTFGYNNGFDPVPEQHFCFVSFAHPEVLGNSADGSFIECNRFASTAEMFAAFEKRLQQQKSSFA